MITKAELQKFEYWVTKIMIYILGLLAFLAISGILLVVIYGVYTVLNNGIVVCQ